jgi:chorismate mutase
MTSLQNIRTEIEELDEQLIGLLARRMHLAREIGALKDAIHDPEREQILKDMHSDLATLKGVEPHFLSKLFEVVFEESRRIQSS